MFFTLLGAVFLLILIEIFMSTLKTSWLNSRWEGSLWPTCDATDGVYIYMFVSLLHPYRNFLSWSLLFLFRQESVCESLLSLSLVFTCHSLALINHNDRIPFKQVSNDVPSSLFIRGTDGRDWYTLKDREWIHQKRHSHKKKKTQNRNFFLREHIFHGCIRLSDFEIVV